jgi:hypothetical protein
MRKSHVANSPHIRHTERPTHKAHRRIRELEAREIDIRRPNRRGTTMFDLDPIAAIFLIIAIVWLIGTVAYGRDHH